MSDGNGRNFTTGVGRVVFGDAYVPTNKGFNNMPLKDKNGNPRQEWVLGVALPKNDPLTQTFWGELYAAAQEGFPHLFANGQRPPNFAWKVVDGDSEIPRSAGGTPPAQKEGYKNCWVVTFKSGFAPQVFSDGADPQPIPAPQPGQPKPFKPGDYVRIGGSVKANQDQSNPGVFVNLRMVQVKGYGTEIVSGPSAATVFATPAALPPGASATPVGSAAPMPTAAPAPAGVPAQAPGFPPPGPVAGQGLPPGAPMAPAPAAAPMAPAPAAAPMAPAPAAAPMAPAPAAAPMAPAPAAAPMAPAPAAAPMAPAPMPGFGAPPQAPAPAPAAAPQMAPGCPYTYAQLKEANYTDEQMRASGYLL